MISRTNGRLDFVAARKEIEKLRSRFWECRDAEWKKFPLTGSREENQDVFRQTIKVLQKCVEIAWNQIFSTGYINWECPDLLLTIQIPQELQLTQAMSGHASTSLPSDVHEAASPTKRQHEADLPTTIADVELKKTKIADQDSHAPDTHCETATHIRMDIPDADEHIMVSHELQVHGASLTPTTTHSITEEQTKASEWAHTHGHPGHTGSHSGGGFLGAIATAFNEYGERLQMWGMRGGRICEKQIAGALGSFLAFNRTSGTIPAGGSVTTEILQHETLMGLSNRKGSLMHILQQSDDSRRIYSQDIEDGMDVYLEMHHIHSLAHLTGCIIVVQNVLAEVLLRAVPPNNQLTQPQIIITATSTTFGSLMYKMQDLIDQHVQIYSIRPMKDPVKVQFSAHVQELDHG